MPDILIRDIPEDVANRLTARAAEDGMDRMSWLRAQLVQLSQRPAIRKSYVFKCFGDNGARVTINRLHDFVQNGANNCSRAQLDAYEKAVLLAKRNEIGDYEAAYKLLLGSFDEVFSS